MAAKRRARAAAVLTHLTAADARASTSSPHTQLTTHGFKSLGLRSRLTSANLRVFLALPMAATESFLQN